MKSRLVFALALTASTANAAPSAQIPQSLEQWVPWVLAGVDVDCPRSASGEPGACVYLGSLELTLDQTGGRFVLDARTFKDSARVPLPGSEKRWPLEVKLVTGGRTGPATLASAFGPARVLGDCVACGPAVVETRGGQPFVIAPAGTHKISGRFYWDALPESIRVPEEIAHIGLQVDGEKLARLARRGASLYLDRAAAPGDDSEKRRLTLKIHRMLEDGVPLMLETRVGLEVWGEARAERLGKVLPEGFVPISVDSRLPSRVDERGELVVQVRPGTHEVRIRAQRSDAAQRFIKPNPGEEVWVFQAAPEVRSVRIEGIAVDPGRTELPDAWKRLPAYRVTDKQALEIFTERRGDTRGGDRLSLAREMWLDFDGKGYTLQDRIGGTLNSGWRLEASEELQLGRVASRDLDQLITELDVKDKKGKGVEVRGRDLSITADARYEGNARSIPALGWSHDFHSVEIDLHLPPGWRLFHATGVDNVSHTWVRSWSPLDLFLLMLLPVFLWRLYGIPWAAIGFFATLLILPESPECVWLIPAALLPEALLRVLPNALDTEKGFGWLFDKAMRALRLSLIIALALVGIGFSAQQIRAGLYPALEDKSGSGMVHTNMANIELLSDSVQSEGKFNKRKKMGKADYNLYRQQLQAFDPKAQVQTGPGLPSWTWNRVHFSYSGPVTQGQRIGLVLMPPVVQAALAFARVALLLLVLLCLIGLPGTRWPRALKVKHPLWGVFAFLLLPLGFAGAAHAQDDQREAPAPKILDELKARLTQKPACAPTCATAGAMRLSAKTNQLTISLDIYTSADIEVPLPGGRAGWLPEAGTIGGKRATALRLDKEGRLLCALPRGAHEVRLSGQLPRAPSVQIPLPLKPHHVFIEAREGWRLDGVGQNGVPDATLQLTREAKERDVDLGQSELKGFVVIERRLNLALTWEVETVVRRLSPVGRAVVVEVPTLPGERVTSDGVRTEGGKVFVNLGPHAKETRWRSTLDPFPEMTLTAPKEKPWVETWTLEAAPLWHVDSEGINPVHTDDDEVKRWQPWPGETVTVRVERPAGATGQTLTIDKAHLVAKPGARATDVSLDLRLRSSRGDQHVITLPDGAQLSEMTIDGKRQPMRQDGRKVKIPLVPGAQSVHLAWRQPATLTTVFKAPVVDLGTPAVNLQVNIRTGDDRWVLWTAGPKLGPAVLLWPLLLVLSVVAILLSRVRSAPPSLIGWVLLGLGISQVGVVAGAFVAGWLLVLAWRKDHALTEPIAFNLRQVLVAGWTAVALCILIYAVGDGLLGSPEMQIWGNDSRPSSLKWTLDRTELMTPSAWMISVPGLVFRAAMLAWSLWLAFALFGWLRKAWIIFSTGGLFRRGVPTPPQNNDAPATGASIAPEGAPVAVNPVPAVQNDKAEDDTLG